MLPSTSLSNLTNKLQWSKPSPKPFRIWFMTPGSTSDLCTSPIGVSARSLTDVKEVYCYVNNGEDVNELNVVRKDDATLIIGDDYLRHLPDHCDLIILQPSQEYKLDVIKRSEVKAKQCDAYDVQQSRDYDVSSFVVPAPKGKVARLTFDFYKRSSKDTGCLRLTAAAAGDVTTTVTYELRLNGLKSLVYRAAYWSGTILCFLGKTLVECGELIKRNITY